MPRGDRTGPRGMGPMTGRRLGFCAGNDRIGDAVTGNYGYGFGRGYRRGFAGRGQMGFGFGHGYGRFREDEVQGVSRKTLLENDARILKDQLASIEKQLSEIDKGTD